MTAGTAQFDADRTLELLQPAVRGDGAARSGMAGRAARVRPGARPHARAISACPKCATSRPGRMSGATGSPVPRKSWRKNGSLPNGDHMRVVAQPLARRRPAAVPRGPHRAAAARVGARHACCGCARRRSTICSKRSASSRATAGSISGTGAFARTGSSTRNGWRSIRASTSSCRRWRASWSIRRRPRRSAKWSARRRTSVSRRSGRISMTDGRHFEFAAVPLPDGNALFTMVDVTDSSRIEAALRERATALEEADRVKTDFVANMSYELRTPLTSIGGFAEMLAGGYAGKLSAEGDDYVARHPRSGRAAVEADRRRARPDAGRHARRRAGAGAGRCRRPVPCGARDGPSRAPPRRRRSSTSEISPAAGYVFGDARRLRELVEHVLAQCHRLHRPEGAHSRSRPTATMRSAVIRIADNGSGIAPEDLPRVFDRFDRVDEAGVRGEAALGLGLAADAPVHRGAWRHGRARVRARARARRSR